jgi:peptidoglycan/xylan/chitin deacetylase (PgdA/CDA1 family)
MEPNKLQIVVRHDDFDFRLKSEEYIKIHQMFLDRDLIETAVIQYTHDGNVPSYDKDLIEYMNTYGGWDIQLHGWAHDNYSELPKWRIREDLKKSKDMSMYLFGKEPTVWYTPWNCRSESMDEVAELESLTISNESYDIAKFIREVKSGEYIGTSFYFHGWKKDEVEQLEEALDLVKQLKEKL